VKDETREGVPSASRDSLIRRGQRLEYFTIGYNSIEGIVAVVAGLIAGSLALVGFGFDSVIEVISGLTLVWRLHSDADETRRERVDQMKKWKEGLSGVVRLNIELTSAGGTRREKPEQVWVVLQFTRPLCPCLYP